MRSDAVRRSNLYTGANCGVRFVASLEYVRDRIRNAGATVLFADRRRLVYGGGHCRPRLAASVDLGAAHQRRGAVRTRRQQRGTGIATRVRSPTVSSEISDVARKAVAVVDRLNIPQDHCHVVFLGYAPASEMEVYV